MSKRCAFSGHRPFYFPWKENESDPACIRLKAALEAEIDKAVADGFFYFIVGGADGVDTWAAEIVLEKRKRIRRLTWSLRSPLRIITNICRMIMVGDFGLLRQLRIV